MGHDEAVVTGDALPDTKVVRRKLAGVPKVEVAGLSKEFVEVLFWDTITQIRAELAEVSKKYLPLFLCNRWQEMGMAARHCRSGAS